MKTVTGPDFGDSGPLYQQVQVAGPGDPGYTGARLPEGDPWAPAVNAALDEQEAAAEGAESYPEYREWTAGPEAGS
jgi:hypothetical protein